MRVKGFDVPELLGALFVVGLALFAIWEASGYPFGAASRMGPGYFPIMLSIILVIFGLVLVAKARRARTDVERIPVRAILAILLWRAIWRIDGRVADLVEILLRRSPSMGIQA